MRLVDIQPVLIYSSAAITAVLLAMAAFTAYGRWRLAPIRPRDARDR